MFLFSFRIQSVSFWSSGSVFLNALLQKIKLCDFRCCWSITRCKVDDEGTSQPLIACMSYVQSCKNKGTKQECQQITNIEHVVFSQCVNRIRSPALDGWIISPGCRWNRQSCTAMHSSAYGATKISDIEQKNGTGPPDGSQVYNFLAKHWMCSLLRDSLCG